MSETTFTDVFAVPGEASIIDVVGPDGRTAIQRETLDEVRQRYPRAECFTWQAWQAEQIAKQDTPVSWREVTADEYERMLDILPPLAWTAGGFLVGEPYDHHFGSGQPRFQGYISRGGKHYASSRALTVTEFRAVRP